MVDAADGREESAKKVLRGCAGRFGGSKLTGEGLTRCVSGGPTALPRPNLWCDHGTFFDFTFGQSDALDNKNCNGQGNRGSEREEKAKMAGWGRNNLTI